MEKHQPMFARSQVSCERIEYSCYSSMLAMPGDNHENAHFLIGKITIHHSTPHESVVDQSDCACDNQNVPGGLVRVAIELRKRSHANGSKSGRCKEKVQFHRKEKTHDVSFLSFSQHAFTRKSQYMVSDRAYLPGNLQFSGGHPQDSFLLRARNLYSVRRSFTKNRRSVPDVENQQPARLQVRSRCLQSRKYVGVLD